MISSLLVGGLAVAVAPAAAATAGEVRVDQVGYGITEAKYAYLIGASGSSSFTVVNDKGVKVLTGKTGSSLGSWSTKYKAVYQLDLSALKTPGKYKVEVTGTNKATSPLFRVDTTGNLFDPLVRANNEFFQSQRDGKNVIPGRLGRKPSHLDDANGAVYAEPKFGGAEGDEILEPLKATGAKRDVEGGWADAGDYVKFTSNSAYSLAEMGFVLREKYDPALAEEVCFGLKWLDKMWDEQSKTLYAQVGIGTGSEKFGFLGDHDVWRLPEADDALNVKPGDAKYYVKYRPVFAANAAGAQISPNLAGRVAAAFALGAQVQADRDPAKAKKYFAEAASIFAQAKTTNVGELVSAFPHAYYPEDSWHDDMELGATQLALAAKKLGDSKADDYARTATQWAKEYIAGGDKSTLNLYDTSALAHADLAGILKGGLSGAKVTEKDLVADLRRQLDSGVAVAAKSPFRTAVEITTFDAASKSYGFAATARLYKRVTGDSKYDAFGVQQRNFTLGANAWGVSLVVGIGTTWPQCPHHQIANLIPDKLLYGAVVNGPNGTELFSNEPLPEGSKACTKPYEKFDSKASRYMDSVIAWQTNEPAIDFTSTALLAFSLAGRN
ncbi:glycoside hydrolase family 9 protein [Amycolatopsis xylanica]|uniref:glycoside hydrolase family 9 protein n=1 Tax=Amycolatopsis xylanica TaxID=589385 RepID=UPI001FDEDFB1|nr:glycoside hydrolase family 9 protein [Amycolatopsis xylanica]